MNEFMSQNEWDSIRTIFDAPYLYLVQLLTGCRHQIRSYFAALNAPLVGDPLYSKIGNVTKEMIETNNTYPQKRLQLHSWRIEFHDGENEICVTAPLKSTT
jgi:23S rRNA-/tRNA-specific pseudouridylate synthase